MFCKKLDCVISNIFDQSPMGNHLGQRHQLVNASQHKIVVGPAKLPVYGMWFDPGFGAWTSSSFYAVMYLFCLTIAESLSLIIVNITTQATMWIRQRGSR